MPKTNFLSDFLSEDMAYWLGLAVGKGTLVRGRESYKLTIDFPFKNLQAKGVKKTYDTPVYLSNSLDGVVTRLKNLGLDIHKVRDNHSNQVSLMIEWHVADISWQLLTYLLNDDHTDYHSFRVPQAIFAADNEKKKEFLRGYFDVTGNIRTTNASFGNPNAQRIYLEIDHRNWFLVLDLYKLLRDVSIPVNTVDFGHPNFRDPHNKKNPGFWAKEHQLKIFANQFLPIGSYLEHKEEVLKELAALNPAGLGANQSRRSKEVPANPEEKSEKLPGFLQGKHFNHTLELLKYLEEIDSSGFESL